MGRVLFVMIFPVYRAANATAPIVAVAPHHVAQEAIAPVRPNNGGAAGGSVGGTWGIVGAHSEVLRHFSEFLTTPVSSAGVRGLVARWLLLPAENVAPVTVATGDSAPVASSGMASGTGTPGLAGSNRASRCKRESPLNSSNRLSSAAAPAAAARRSPLHHSSGSEAMTQVAPMFPPPATGLAPSSAMEWEEKGFDNVG